MMVILKYLGIILFLFIGLSLWGFYISIHPPKIETPVKPADLGWKAEEVDFKTSDGLLLRGWFVPSSQKDSSQKAIVVLHGYPADKANMLYFAGFLHPEYNLLFFDFRYFGQSEGSYTTVGIKERLDLKAALDFLQKRGINKVGLLGFSMGGAVAVMGAPQTKMVKAVAAYAPYANLRLLAQTPYRNFWILKKPLGGLTLKWARIFLGIDVEQDSPLQAAQELKKPIFIIHSQKDKQVPIKHGHLLEDALRNNKKTQFLFPEKGLHGSLPPAFETKVLNFFKKYL